MSVLVKNNPSLHQGTQAIKNISSPLEGFFNFVQLETTKRYTLGKEERLKSRKLIEQLFKEGKAYSVFPLRVIYVISVNPAGTCGHSLQAGFTVGTKYFKKAVDRNRIKRLLKEAYRLQKNDLHNKLLLDHKSLKLFFIYTGKDKPGYELILVKTALAIKHFIKITDERTN